MRNILAICPFLFGFVDFAAAQTVAARSQDFVDSIGVNTHLNNCCQAYGNYQGVAAALNQIGIHHVRDTFPGASNADTERPYLAMMQGGIKFDFQVAANNVAAENVIANDIAVWDSLETQAPGSIEHMEGLNEVDLIASYSYNGTSNTIQAAQSFQSDLYSAVHADRLMTGVSVYNLSLSQGGNEAMLGDMSGVTDFCNDHTYFQSVPSSWNLGNQLLGQGGTPGDDAPCMASAKPNAITETGYCTWAGDGINRENPSVYCINEDAQAKYYPNIFYNSWNLGVRHTYAYEFLDDAPDPTNTFHELHFGLLRSDLSFKPAATVLQNTIAILIDTSTRARSFTPGSVGYQLSWPPGQALDGQGGRPSSGSLLMEKAGGKFALAVWPEVNLWTNGVYNSSPGSEPTIQPTMTTVQLGRSFAAVSYYDPMQGTSPVAQYSNVSAITLPLSDHALIVRFSN